MPLCHRAMPVLLLAALAAAGCGPAAPATPATAPTLPPTTAAPATAQPGSSSIATTAPTKKPTSGNAQVDLQFSGTRVIFAKGTAGRCSSFPRSDGTVAFGFEATETDYPGLGQSFSIANLSGDFIDIKWVVGDKIAYGDPGSGLTLSPDHHLVTLDVELSPFTPQGGTAPGPEHVKGTITCP